MRKGGIPSLRWDQVDIKRSNIRLKSGDTKTGEGRVILMNRALTGVLKSATKYLGCPWASVNSARVDP